MKTVIFVIALFITTGGAFGQKSADPAYKIRVAKGGVTVAFQGKAHRLLVGAHIDAAKVKSAEVLFAGEKDGVRYLVIDVSGDSRDGNYDRQCGAGIESNLLWLKLDAAWNILDVKSVRYQSCWSGTDLNEPFKFTKKTLDVEFDNIRDNLNIKLTYNAEEPEKGFQIRETALKDQ